MAESSQTARSAPSLAGPPSSVVDPASQSLSTSVNPTLNTFTCFPKLPLELRLIIWSMTIEPRTITVVPDLMGRNFRLKGEPPIGIRISQESRREVLKFYQLWLNTRRMVRSTHGFYLNPSIDTIYIRDIPKGHDFPDFYDFLDEPFGKYNLSTMSSSSANMPQIHCIAIHWNCLIMWGLRFCIVPVILREFFEDFANIDVVVHVQGCYCQGENSDLDQRKFKKRGPEIFTDETTWGRLDWKNSEFAKVFRIMKVKWCDGTLFPNHEVGDSCQPLC